MAQGQFTKEEAQRTNQAIAELYDAIPKSKQADHLGRLNDASLFVAAAGRRAPSEKAGKPKPPRKSPAAGPSFDGTPANGS